jgi:hypothetical protein
VDTVVAPEAEVEQDGRTIVYRGEVAQNLNLVDADDSNTPKGWVMLPSRARALVR